MRRILGAALLLAASACTHSIHQYNVGDYDGVAATPAASRKLILVETQQSVVLGFVQDTNYLDQAREKLLEACPNGRISGIQTRLSTSHGFLSWTNKMKVQAYCLAGR